MIITVNSILPDAKGNEYKVVNNIKSGGFGQVFLCERLTDGKHFALKTMLNAFPTEDEYNAFQNEINTAITIKVFFASTFWKKLKSIFGECCISKLEKVAKPRLAAILPAT